MTRKAIVFVDAMSTGLALASRFKSSGLTCLHVQSKVIDENSIPANLGEIKSQLTHLAVKLYCGRLAQDDISQTLQALYRNPAIASALRVTDIFSENFVNNGNIASLATDIANQYEIIAVLPGHESGVLVADALSHALKLPTTNDHRYSEARRNKFLMHKALQEENITSVKHFKSDNFTDIRSWVLSHTNYPVVLKPVSGAGGIDVKVCLSEEIMKAAFDRIMANKTIFQEQNTEVLVQNFIAGREYSVNTVSYDGHHVVCEILDTDKPVIKGNPSVYYHQDYVPCDSEIFIKLAEYAQDVLNALRINYGPAHLEIKITREGSPTLIEIGARLMGGTYQYGLATEFYKHTQISLTEEAYLNPQQFCLRSPIGGALPDNEAKAAAPKTPLYARKVFLVSASSGELQRPLNTTPIKALQTLLWCDFFYSRKGDHLPSTEHNFTMPGVLYLLSHDFEKIESDTSSVRAWEETAYAEALEEKTISTTDYLLRNLAIALSIILGGWLIHSIISSGIFGNSLSNLGDTMADILDQSLENNSATKPPAPSLR